MTSIERSRHRPSIPFALLARLVVAAGLTAYLLWKSQPSAVLGLLEAVSWPPLLAAVGLVLFDRALMAYRWVALLCTLEPHRRPRLQELLRIFFVSTFVGTFLPASVGGDAVRSYSVAKLNVPGGDAVASVFMDRMLGVASLLLMALAGLGLARSLMTAANTSETAIDAVLLSLTVTGVVCGVTLLLIFHRATAAAATRLATRLPAGRVRRAGTKVLESVRKYASYPRVLLGVLLCSIAVQVLRVLQAYYLGRSLGIQAPPGIYFAFVPLILIVMLLPVTFNGIGTSQAAFVWFFARAGVPEASAFALSVLFVALGIIGNLPGAALYIAGRQNRQPV